MAHLCDTNGYLEVPGNLGDNVTGAFLSLACWFKPLAAQTGAGVSKGATSTNRFQYGLEQHTAGTSWRFFIGNGGSVASEISGGSPVVGRWSHLVGTAETAVQRLYVDGKQVATAAPTTTIGSGNIVLRFGRWANNILIANAWIAEACVWAAGLTPDEVVRLYQGESPRNIRPQQLRVYSPLTGRPGTEEAFNASSAAPTVVGTSPRQQDFPASAPREFKDYMVPLFIGAQVMMSSTGRP